MADLTDHERLHAIEAYCRQNPTARASQIDSRFLWEGWCKQAHADPPPIIVEPPPVASPLPVKAGWKRVIETKFDQDGVIPDPWANSEGGGFTFRTSGSHCRPQNATVSGGLLRLLMKWDDAGHLGPGWYCGYIAIKRALRGAPYASTDQTVTLRWRVQNNGVRGHSNVPMRWPAAFAGHPNKQGEEDCWEGSGMNGATTFLHYTNPDGTAGRVSRSYTGVDMSQFHVYRFERSNLTFKTFVDNMETPLWVYQGNRTTLPDYPKIPLLQQESRSYYEAGPSGQPKSAGTEEIQVDWITVDNPA
jgi:hypothetical protein